MNLSILIMLEKKKTLIMLILDDCLTILIAQIEIRLLIIFLFKPYDSWVL